MISQDLDNKRERWRRDEERTERDLLDLAVDVGLDGENELDCEVEQDEDEREVEEELEVAVVGQGAACEGVRSVCRRKESRRVARAASWITGGSWREHATQRLELLTREGCKGSRRGRLSAPEGGG